MNVTPALNTNSFYHLRNETEIIKIIIGLQIQMRYFNIIKQNQFNNLLNSNTQINAGLHRYLQK